MPHFGRDNLAAFSELLRNRVNALNEIQNAGKQRDISASAGLTSGH